jgi:hypothetical protein
LPKQDFIVLLLETITTMIILSAFGGTVPNSVIYVQIKRGALLEFAAYDNFHPTYIVFGAAVKLSLIESLISPGIIRPYTQPALRD